MQEAHLVQDLYPKSLAGAFELMFCRSGWYQSLGQRQGQRSGHGSHNGELGNGDRSYNYHNCRVIFLQQGEINMTPVPSIDGSTIDAVCYYCYVPGHLSNSFPGVSVERRRNRGSGDRGSGGRTCTGMCHIFVGLSQHDYGIIPSTCLLLDTCSTSSVGKNPDMFKNIRECLE